MESKIKRERKKNFAMDEIQLLTAEYGENKDVLELKFTNALTNKQKNDSWQRITEKINALGYEKRTVEEIKMKWRNLTSQAKANWNNFKRDCNKTGGGPAPAPPTEDEMRIVNLYEGHPKFDGLDGFQTFPSEETPHSINTNSVDFCSDNADGTIVGGDLNLSSSKKVDDAEKECEKKIKKNGKKNSRRITDKCTEKRNHHTTVEIKELKNEKCKLKT